MTHRQLRLIWVVLGVSGLLFLVQVAGFSSTREYLCAVKSEIRYDGLPTLRDLAGVSASDPVVPTSAPAPDQEGDATAALPVADPLARNARADGDPEDPDPWWLRALRAARGLVRSAFFVAGNRSWEEGTPDEAQAEAVTVDAFAARAVFNDPVLPHTGEMTFRQPIVRIPGTGFDFSLELNYRSGFNYDGPVGSRWDHNWNARIKDSGSSGDITRYYNCRRDVYTASGDNFTSPAGQFEKSVTRYTSGSDKVVDRKLQDGTLERYRKPNNYGNWYYLERVQHRDSDNEIVLYYDPDDSHKLTRITDTRGRYFEFKYDGNDRATKIEDHSSGTSTVDRYWKLMYSTGTYSGWLKDLILPDVGNTYRTMAFGYEGTIALLTDVTAPREFDASGGPYLHMDYDGNGKVITQRFGESGQYYVLSYGTGTFTEVDRQGTERRYAVNTTTKAITSVTVAMGASDPITSYAWTASGLLTKVTLPENNGIQYAYDGGRLTAMARCTSSEMSQAINRASSGQLVTEYSYEAASNHTLVTKITDPNGNEWSLGRDALGNVTSYKTPEHTQDPWVLSYDSYSRLVTATDPEGRITAYNYGATGILTKVTLNPASLAIATTYVRDKYENVVTVTDAEGEDTVYERNALGYVTKVTSSEDYVTDVYYDLNDVVTEVRRDNGNADMPNTRHKVRMEYSLLDIVTKVIEYHGSSYSASRVWEYAYDKEDRLTLTTLPVAERMVSSVYDARGLEVTRTVGNGEQGQTVSEYFEYDQNGRITTSKDGSLNSTALAYDQFDRLTKVTDPAGHYRQTTFDKNGNAITRESYASGATLYAQTVFDFDDDNLLTRSLEMAKMANLTTAIGSGWITRTMTYDKAGLLTTKTDPCGCGGGTDQYFTYDGASRLSTKRDARNNLVRLGLDKAGRTTKVSADEVEGAATKTYVVEYGYDKDGHLTEIDEKGAGSATALSTTITVDAWGRARIVADPNGNEIRYKRDDFGRVITKLIQKGQGAYITLRTEYDLNDNVLSQIGHPGGSDAVTAYAYDACDRVTAVTDEGGTSESFTYDAGGNLTRAVDRNGSTKVLTYDSRNLLSTKAYTLATNVRGPTTVRFWYDPLGRVTKAFNQDGLVERKWNTLSKLEMDKLWIMPTNDSGSGSTPRQVDYTYDGSGLLTEMEYPDNGITIKKGYDALNRVTKIQKKPSGGSYADLATWAFEGPARMTQLEYANNTKESLRYDEYGRATLMTHDRLVGQTRTKMYEFKRGYDSASRPEFERRDYWKSSDGTILPGQRDFGDRYYYDPANRLTKVIRGVGYQSTQDHSLVETAAETTMNYVTRTEYTLDDAGNRQTLLYWDSNGSQSQSVRREDQVFDIENQLSIRYEITVGGSTQTLTYTYDANGNQVSSYSPGPVKVDIENRIYEYGNWRYRYDPFGRRIEKHDTSGGFWVRYYYDGWQCIEEHVTYDPEPPTNAPSSGGTNSNTPAPAAVECDDPIWRRVYGPYYVDQILWGEHDPDSNHNTTNHKFYFHLDYLYSVVMITSDDGNSPIILESYRYDEYGQPYFYDGNGNIQTQGSNYEQDKLYTGRRWDPEMEIYYYRARYFSQGIGLFLSRDPVGFDRFLNGYQYVRADPISNIDPMGLQPEPGWSPEIQAAINQFYEATLKSAVKFIGDNIEEYKVIIDNGGTRALDLHADAFLDYPIFGMSKEKGDAFRHCLWSCYMARLLGGGPAQAWKTGREREAWQTAHGHQEAESQNADNWNNWVGVNCPKSAGKDARQDCYDCCSKAVKGGVATPIGWLAAEPEWGGTTPNPAPWDERPTGGGYAPHRGGGATYPPLPTPGNPNPGGGAPPGGTTPGGGAGPDDPGSGCPGGGPHKRGLGLPPGRGERPKGSGGKGSR